MNEFHCHHYYDMSEFHCHHYYDMNEFHCHHYYDMITDAVDWAMQALLRACFSDLLVIDMKEILQQRMFEDKSYEAHEDHKNLYDTVKKSLERDYSNQLLSDLEEARQKKRKRGDLPRTPTGSPPSQPPPPPPPAGTSGALGTSGESGSSQLPLPPPPLSTGRSGSAQQQGSYVIIQIQFFFNKDFEYLRYGSKGSSLALPISKMKATSYPDFGLELPMPKQMWIDNVKDFQLGIEILQTQLNLTKPGWDATAYEFKHDYTIIESPRAVVFPVNNNERKIMRFNKIYKFSDGMLTRILEARAYRFKEFKIKRLNSGMNTRFWTQKDVTMRKEFIAAIERRLKMRMIYQNLECFVGGQVHDIDYRLL
nr:hypothetical protein [Tanacetum cinerariifolium]